MITRRISNLPDDAWIRTCQECGHMQVDGKPTSDGPSNAFLERKCRGCKSSGSLDYGCENASDGGWADDE